MDGGAYGAGKAGTPFDPLTFIKKPQVIVRIVSLVFSIIVFGCIASGAWYDFDQVSLCQMGGDPNACGFGTGIGVIAFCACIAFLVLDAVFEQLSGIQYRKYIVMADMAFSGFWSLMWFICFCYMTNKWTTNPPSKPNPPAWLPRDGYGANDVQAAIAFSFFSIISWVALTVLAVLRYRQGVTEDFAPSGYEPEGPGASPYSEYPSGGMGPSDSYQQPPFNPNQEEKTAPDYQPPTY